MSKQTINVGNAANDGTGTPTRTAFQYVNANFTELYNAVGGGNGTIPSSIPISKGGTGGTSASDARSNLGLKDAAIAIPIGSWMGTVLMRGAFGIGGRHQDGVLGSTLMSELPLDIGFEARMQNQMASGSIANGYPANNFYGAILRYAQDTHGANIAIHANTGSMWVQGIASNNLQAWKQLLILGAGATKDGNGFIKAASPIVQLFSDKIELNDEAKLQGITFEKLGVGDYVIKGSTGFAQEGWYVEMPKDANGNVLVAVVYKQLENNDISVKTYKKKFDIETASIVADLTQPVDIPEGRWIDLRLQELPQEVIDEP